MFNVIQFIWFLNDIDDGMLTIWENFNIKPEKGKLVMFPSTWSFPYMHHISMTCDKYIISGCLKISMHDMLK